MSTKNISVFKFVLFLFLGMVGLWVLSSLVNTTGYGRMGFGINFNYGHMGVDWFDPATWDVNFILLVFFRIFCFLFIVGLVVGLVMAAKDYIFSNNNNGNNITPKLTTSVTSVSDDQKFCIKCGKSIGSNWKVCAYCGEEIKAST